MEEALQKIIQGYQQFREKYVLGDNAIMHSLASNGQQPQIMIIACCDSRVDPALLLQCDPGDLFVVRNVANIVPPYEKDLGYHGTSAALEFGLCYLNIKHLILLGHSQCGGINALLNSHELHQNDFISKWVSVIESDPHDADADQCAQASLTRSYQNCLSFPWIKARIDAKTLQIHQWFFNIMAGEIYTYHRASGKYQRLCA